MRLKVKRRDWDSFLRQEVKSLSERSLPSRDYLRNRLLILVTTPENQGWNQFLISSHTRRKTKSWLLTKALLMDLGEPEDFLLKYITAGDPEWVQLLVDISLDISISRAPKTRFLQYLYLQQDLPDHRSFSTRFLNSFQPSLEIFRVWMEKKRIPAKAFIGVGYKDHGSLGSGLSWKDQMLGEGECSDIIGRIHSLLRLSVSGSLEDPVTGAFPSGWKQPGLKRPSRPKRGLKRKEEIS